MLMAVGPESDYGAPNSRKVSGRPARSRRDRERLAAGGGVRQPVLKASHGPGVHYGSGTRKKLGGRRVVAVLRRSPLCFDYAFGLSEFDHDYFATQNFARDSLVPREQASSLTQRPAAAQAKYVGEPMAAFRSTSI
jgi:hypothetical protein